MSEMSSDQHDMDLDKGSEWKEWRNELQMYQKVTLVRRWDVDVLGDPFQQTEAVKVGSEDSKSEFQGYPPKGMTQQ